MSAKCSVQIPENWVGRWMSARQWHSIFKHFIYDHQNDTEYILDWRNTIWLTTPSWTRGQERLPPLKVATAYRTGVSRSAWLDLFLLSNPGSKSKFSLPHSPTYHTRVRFGFTLLLLYKAVNIPRGTFT